MKTPKKIRKSKLIVTLPPELKRRLEVHARFKGEPATHYVREALVAYLDANEARP